MTNIINIFIILFSIIGLESILLIFIVMKTPALIFLRASLTNSKIMYIMGKDKMGIFRTFRTKFGNARIKNEGIYNITENSHTLEAKTKIPIYFAFRDFAATLKPEYAALIQELRSKGAKITNIDDLSALVLKLKKGMKEYNVDIKPFTTYKLHDLDNLFPFNLDPTFIDAQVQGELNKFNKLMRAAPLAIMSFVVLIITVGVTIFIIQKAFKGQISISDCKSMIDTGKIANVVIQSINSTLPLVP